MLWPLLGLGAVGTVVLRRRRVPLLPLLAPLAVVTVAAAVFYGRLRFRCAAEVPIVVLAAVGVDQLVGRTDAPLVRAGA
jgi:hypothetical protein